MAANIESEALFTRILDYLQSNRRLRFAVGALLILVLLGIAGRSIYHLVPRHYTLTISGGDIVNNRHFLARLLQAEAPKHNLTLIVEPISSGLDTLERLIEDAGALRFGFSQHVQGGSKIGVAAQQVCRARQGNVRGAFALAGVVLQEHSRVSLPEEASLCPPAAAVKTVNEYARKNRHLGHPVSEILFRTGGRRFAAACPGETTVRAFPVAFHIPVC